MSQLHPIAKLEKLLLSTDGSEFSEGAVREAVKLAKICSSRLFAVSVIETNPELEVLAPQLIEKEEEKTRVLLEQIKSMAAKEDIACEIIARHAESGNRIAVIVRARSSAPIDKPRRQGFFCTALISRTVPEFGSPR